MCGGHGWRGNGRGGGAGRPLHMCCSYAGCSNTHMPKESFGKAAFQTRQTGREIAISHEGDETSESACLRVLLTDLTRVVRD